MKKSLLLFAIVLAGCAKVGDGMYRTSIFNPAPPQMIRNEKCEDIPAVKVSQVLSNYVLADVVKTGTDRVIVAVPKSKGESYYNDKIIEPKEGQCISFSGTYKYRANDEQTRTVPKIKMVDAEVPNPEYEEWLKEQAE